MEKLIKYVARVSLYSRRKSEELIKAGKVRINNAVVTEPSAAVTSVDSVSVNNEVVYSDPVKLYIALNKPDGYMSDLQDPQGRKVARELINIDVKLFPVGRLDYHSEGLMIFTNDGDFANTIMHPRYGIEKEYLVKVKGVFEKDDVKKMKEGIVIDGEVYKIEGIHFVRHALKNTARDRKQKIVKRATPHRLFRKEDRTESETKNTWYSVIINEGKNRMIRKIGDAMSHPVLKLKRIRIGKLELENLQPGKYRYFEKREALDTSKNSNKKKNNE
jgi:23S rRNA pseudouridine2605 synthase